MAETILNVLSREGAADSESQQTVREVLGFIRRHVPIARDIPAELDQKTTFGEHMADRVAQIGGSWGFVIGFGLFLLVWATLNLALLPRAERFDPYPFIFLNLLLSMLAAIQAPIIMMSQNRQAAKDRLENRHDYEVNLKAELEIMTLHEKLDRLEADHAAQFAALRALLERRSEA